MHQWGRRSLVRAGCYAVLAAVRRGLLSVPNNVPFRDHENSFTGHVLSDVIRQT